MSILHFVTGKGGTGKSTFASALVRALSEKREGPVLLIEVQGSGRSLEMLGLTQSGFANTPIFGEHEVWGSRIFPQETFRQYFSLLLAMGKQNSTWANATAAIRDKLVDVVFENKIVSSFIETCPGLEPAVLLGKLHWEATRGRAPERDQAWAHVVVDAPATGHGVMLFRSAFALTEVFSTGIIAHQAQDIRSFVTDPKKCRIYITSTAEELPLAESVELARRFADLQMTVYRVVINRMKSLRGNDAVSAPGTWSDEWKREFKFEEESMGDEVALLDQFFKDLPASIKSIKIPELFVPEPRQMLPEIAKLAARSL